jgi:hypothetical protein
MGRKWVRIAIAVALTAMFGFGVTLIGVGLKQLREPDRNQATQQRIEQMLQRMEQVQQRNQAMQLEIDQLRARANGGRPSGTPGAER